MSTYLAVHLHTLCSSKVGSNANSQSVHQTSCIFCSPQSGQCSPDSSNQCPVKIRVLFHILPVIKSKMLVKLLGCIYPLVVCFGFPQLFPQLGFISSPSDQPFEYVDNLASYNVGRKFEVDDEEYKKEERPSDNIVGEPLRGCSLAFSRNALVYRLCSLIEWLQSEGFSPYSKITSRRKFLHSFFSIPSAPERAIIRSVFPRWRRSLYAGCGQLRGFWRQ